MISIAFSAFEKTLLQLRSNTAPPPLLTTKIYAALADLAADNLEPTADRTRALLIAATYRVEEIWPTDGVVHSEVANWRRSITFFPAKNARALRCFAIREAERRMRDAFLTDGVDPPYRSSSVSQ